MTNFFLGYPAGRVSKFTRRAASIASLRSLPHSSATDGQGRATELVPHWGGFEQHAKRIDEADAKALKAVRAARIANRTSSPGAQQSLRRFTDSMKKRQPNHDKISPPFAAANCSQVSRSGPLIKSLGALQSITFRTVNAEGLEVHDASFEKGRVGFFIAPLTPDGKVTAYAWEALSPFKFRLREQQYVDTAGLDLRAQD